MLKKVILTNVHSGQVSNSIVDTETDDKALIGAGKTSVESAQVRDVTGLDESIQRLTTPKSPMNDRVSLFGGLARCFERNLPVIKSFQLQASRVKSPTYKGAIADIADEISKGEKMSDAMAKKTTLFSDDVIALIRAGEESGKLPEIFRRIADSQKKSSRIIRKLKTGMIYPAVVLVIGLGVVIVMSFTLVPAMSKLYTLLGTDLPTPTKIMMQFSNILLKQPWLVAIPVVGLVLFFKNWGKINSIPLVQNFFLKLPTVSNIIRKSASAIGFRTLALLIEANVRMTTALDITADTCWHHQYKSFFKRVKEHILNGMTLPDAFLIESHALGEDGRMICGIMEVAAETGTGTESLNEIAEDYEDELGLNLLVLFGLLWLPHRLSKHTGITTGERLGKYLTMGIAILLGMIALAGVTAPFLIEPFWAFSSDLNPGLIYSPPLNGLSWTFGASGMATHLFRSGLYLCWVTTEWWPSWIIMASLAMSIRCAWKSDSLRSPAVILLATGIAYLGLCWIAQTPIGHRYMAVGGQFLIAGVLYWFLGILGRWSSRSPRPAIVTMIIILALSLVELGRYWPCCGAYRPLVMRYPIDENPAFGDLKAPWLSWGEESQMAAEILKQNPELIPRENTTVFFLAGGAAIGQVPVAITRWKGAMSLVSGQSDDLLIVSRAYLAQRKEPFPFEAEPLFEIGWGSWSQAWVYRLGDLYPAYFKRD